MAVRSGGPKPPRPPPRAASPAAAKPKDRTPSKPDAPKDAYATSAGAAPTPRAERRGHPRAILEQAVASTTAQLAKLEQDAGRVLAVLAEAGYGVEAIQRHRKQLARVRAMIEAARKRLEKSRRALAAIESGAEQLPESELSRVARELERLESYSTDWGRALAAVELAAGVGVEEPKRKLVMKGGDRRAAMRHAERTNPTTAIADLAAAPSEDGGEPLGRSLDGQRALAALISKGR